MEYELDPVKDEINRIKHQLPLLVATGLFDGPFIEREDDRFDYGETRLVATGPIARLNDRIHVAVYMLRDGKRRLISVRKANDKEVREYRHGNP